MREEASKARIHARISIVKLDGAPPKTSFRALKNKRVHETISSLELGNSIILPLTKQLRLSIITNELEELSLICTTEKEKLLESVPKVVSDLTTFWMDKKITREECLGALKDMGLE